MVWARSSTATCASATCRPTRPTTPTRAPACRPRRSPCRAGRRCWLRCSPPIRARCTSWRAVMAAAISVPRWTSTTAPSTATNVGRNEAMTTGLFITFEGIDGAGKSSHIETLAQALRAAGRSVTLTREPGGTPLAEKLRALLLSDSMDALTETLLVFAMLRDHLCRGIEPALARGEVVLCDRFTDATFAYQGAGRGFDLDVLSYMERLAQTGLGLQPNSIRNPDLTLWFDVPPEVAAQRLAMARAPDRFEAEPAEFFARVARGYADRAASAPRRFARLDGAQAREQVAAQMLAAVAARGWL